MADIPDEVRSQLTFVFARTVDDVLLAALLPQTTMEAERAAEEAVEKAKKPSQLPRAA